MSKLEELKEIRDEVWNLKKSPLYEERTKNNAYPVIGEGSHNAKIMFIGEAPGKNEAATGRPFCGRSGKVLDSLLNHINLNRKDVYITNIVKDRPANNRDPKTEEIELYAPFLDRQIEIIEPEIIVTLGRFSMEYIMKRYGLIKSFDSISKIHGHKFETKFSYGQVFVLPLYHPAVAVYNNNMLNDLKKDFENILILIKEINGTKSLL
jgi:uracil-DNA glycosylase